MVSHAFVRSGKASSLSLSHSRGCLPLLMQRRRQQFGLSDCNSSIYTRERLTLFARACLFCDWWMRVLQSSHTTTRNERPLSAPSFWFPFVSLSLCSNMMNPDGNLHRGTFQDAQPSQLWATPRNPCSSSPGKRCLAPYRIPIIPSVHSHQDETSCMQTTTAEGPNQSLPRQGGTGGRVDNSLANPLCHRVGAKWKEGTRSPEQAREKPETNTNMKKDDAAFPNPHAAKETVCILRAGGSGPGGTAPSGPTETQLLRPRDMHKDSTQPRQWKVLRHTLCLENKAAECSGKITEWKPVE